MNTEITVALITTGVPVVGGGIGWMVTHLLKVTRLLGEVKDQVANDHGSNLRDDMDFMRDVLLDVKTDVGWVRRDHMDLAHRVTILEGHQ